MLFALSQLSSILDANLVGDGSIAPTGVGLDSRSIQRGECFTALRAERDGHEYAAMAIEKGASCLLVDHNLDMPVPQLVVNDTLAALQTWGQARLRACRPSAVFGVTGSVGKTSTKELLAGAISAWKTPGNRNNTLGLPAALAALPDGLDAAVLEMGMSTPGEIQRLTEIAPLDFGVITNVGIAHMGNFPNGQEGIACAKGELAAGLIPGGAWVFPKDDPWCQWISKQSWTSKSKPIPVGPGADFSVASVESLGLRGERFILKSPMGNFDFEIKFRGRHQVQNALLAVSIALIAGFKGNEIAHGLASVEPEEGRGRLSPLSGGGWLLDESYNASQESMLSCARALLDLDGGEPIAVLGCMRELGSESASLHEAVGVMLRQIGISRLWVYGDFAMELACGFGYGASAYTNFETLRLALAELPKGARILVKGSRYWMSERVVEYLLNKSGGAEQAGINNVEGVK
ncbi:MAG: UDP-N-acetylmuramoyl-tripeptide--D-alanyl-D-alanine ligase [Holophagales bacterium]|jgi:UDP-N-acetylmuramoyl-tripeptide--D-alanyl-D-alanine ligase|nr:UDP-N-acetylmuramoyl-tripeptide--D-alanyl-D-alanine ligase [Holophagales bacterium]